MTDPTDLIARLRALSRHEHDDHTIGDKAADALETTQAERDRAHLALSLAGAIAWEWRMDWSDFDGRTLVGQIGGLTKVSSGEWTEDDYRAAYDMDRR
ncbi:MAG: hypothetical protein GY773_22795 [Actinomycetia bacterium]|nr:hypothetical protein [Actinomycetes bacterium]